MESVRRKYRGALRVVELSAEVERLLTALPRERRSEARHEAEALMYQALRELWSVSPVRGVALAQRLGLRDPTPHDVRLSPFDKFRYRRSDDYVPCGARMNGVKRYCRRPRGHAPGWCSESRF